MPKYKNKCCFVPSCQNTVKNSPQKTFISVPKAREIRQQWFRAVGREAPNTTTTYLACEDHFNLETDMDNYMEFRIMGVMIRMKKNVRPHLMLGDHNIKIEEMVHGGNLEIYLVDQPSDSDQIDFNQKCRCCLINTGEMTSFYDLYSSETCVSELFTLMTSLEVSGDQDLLPTKICHECLCELSQSYKFVLKCRESDNKLRKYLSKETKYKNKFTHTDGLGVKTKNAFTQTIEVIVFANDVKLEIDEFDPLSDISLEHHTFGYKSNHSKSLNGVHAPNYESVNVINETENNLNEFDILKHEIKVENEHLNDSDEAPPGHKLQSVDVSQFNQLQEAIDVEDESKQDVTAGTRDSGYNCKFCQRSFKIYSLLKSHQKIHSKTKTTTIDSSENPYTCAICEKSFKKKIPIIYHMRTHTGEKPYSCKLCDKSSSRSCTLHYHIRTHTGEKPYSRSSCSESFNRTERLVTYL